MYALRLLSVTGRGAPKVTVTREGVIKPELINLRLTGFCRIFMR